MSFIDIRLYGALACALPLAACGDSVSNLGVYQRELQAEAGSPMEASTEDAASTLEGGPGEASADAGPMLEPDDAASQLNEAFEGAPPCARTGCVSSAPPADEDPAVHCHELFIRETTGTLGSVGGGSAGGSIGGGFDASRGAHVGFSFPAPVKGTEYLRSITPLIGNPATLHHVTLRESKTPPTDPDAPYPKPRLLFNWSPGMPSLYLDRAVGIEVSGDTQYILEVHYVNTTEFDRSGVKLCFTPTAPAHLVSISSLAASGPPAGPVLGTCAPRHTRPIVILGARPKLNANGTRVQLVLNRDGRGPENLLDEPYDDEINALRVLSAPLMPGDSLSTRCEFNPPPMRPPEFEDLPFSDATCDVTVLHWPAHTLVSNPAAWPDTVLESCLE